MPDKSAVLKEAQRYLARGQIDKAIVEWEKLVKEFPDGNAYNTIGDLYLKKGNKRAAIEFFHKAADFFRREGFSLKALALYKKIINIDPSDSGSFIALGELSEEKGLITDAIKYYLSAADILSKEANKEKFLGIYERILSLAPSNIPLREKVAGLFMKEGLSSQAMREYNKIARLYSEKGEPEEARVYFGKVLDIQPDNKDALEGVSEIYDKRGDSQQAVAYLKKAADKHHGDAGLLLRYASLLKKNKAYDEAMNYASKASELLPSDIEAHKLIGDIQIAKGNRDLGWESYKKVVEHLVHEDKTEAAIELARDFKDIDPIGIGKLLISLYRQTEDMEAVFGELLFAADILSESGEHDEAIGLYKEALSIHPDDTQLKKMIAEHETGGGPEPSAGAAEKSAEDLMADADIFIQYGLYDEARSILEELKSREPENTDVHIKLKSLYLETGDKEMAVTECLILSGLHERRGDSDLKDLALKEAIDINPDDPRLLLRKTAGEEFPSEEVEEEAEEHAPPVSEERVPSQDLEDYVEDMAEAEFYLRQGLKDEALSIYEKLLKLFPDNTDFRDKVDSLRGHIEPALGGEEKTAAKEDFVSFETETVEAHEMDEAVQQHLDTDVLGIFEEFKKGIEKELEAEDFETHYNLGIAYKEMGLIDDAIKEFQTSKKDAKFSVRSMSMLGICYMDKGLFPLAIEAFRDAVDNIHTRDESYWGARYDLASAYEKNGNLEEAFEIFSEIYGLDSKFRQVAEKVSRLQNMAPKKEAAMKEKGKKDRISYL